MTDLVHRFGPAGAAPAVVLLHGFTGSPVSWRAAASRCASPAAAIALPGHHPAADVVAGFEANVERVVDTIAGAGLSGCALVGYSLGARVALGIAARHPRVASSLVLIGVHPGLADDGARALRRARDREWVTLLRERGVAAFVSAWEAQPLFATQARAGAARLAEQRAVRLGHSAEALARSLEAMGLAEMPCYRAALGEVVSRIPVQLVTGGEDAKFTGIAREIAAAEPAVRLTVRPGIGHNVILEDPEILRDLGM